MEQLESSQTVQVEAPRAQELRRERPSPAQVQRENARENTREEVRISDRARALNSASAPTQGAGAVTPATPSDQIAPVEFSSLHSVIAVRVGVVTPSLPGLNELANADQITREALTRRAGLIPIGKVIDTDRPDRDGEASAVPLPGSGESEDGREAAELPPLPGSGGRGEADFERPSLPGTSDGRVVSTPKLRASEGARSEPVELPQPQERARESQQRPVQAAEVTQASGTAPKSGAVGNSDSGRRSEVLGSSDRPAGQAVAERTLTQAGVVEAKAEDELVTRFLAGTPDADPGPEPRVKEELTVRSTPPSV